MILTLFTLNTIMATVDSSNMSTSNRGNPADRNQNSLQQEVHELASQLRALKQRRSCTCSLINLLGFLIGILGMLIAISATTDLRQYSVVNFILQTSSGERFKDMETLEIQQSLIAENQVLKKKLEAVEQRQIIGESPKDTQALIAENQLLKKKLETIQQSNDHDENLKALESVQQSLVTENELLKKKLEAIHQSTDESIKKLEAVQQSLVSENQFLRKQLAVLNSRHQTVVDSKLQINNGYTKEEIMAQAICQSIAIKQQKDGFIFAVQRECALNKPTCEQICSSSYLHVQDQETVNRKWSTAGAIHVHMNRPPTAPGTHTNPVMGAKTCWSSNYHTWTDCGPNFCCCHAN